jgi:RNA polymerase sigma-70 factor (ECF subfamily)
MTAPAVTDAELVHAARSGDAVALGCLLQRHRAALYASALALLGDRELAQDAVQDTCLAALRHLDELRDPAAAAGWLHVILRNTCRMRLRRAAREVPLALVEDTGTTKDTERAVEALALRDWVWTALEQLPEDQRVTVMLRYFGRHASYQEVAATLGVPVGTIRSRLSQARGRLARSLLATAGTAHLDHTALLARRRREWEAIVHEVYTAGTATLYAADCAADLLVEAPALHYRAHGILEQQRGVEESAAAGVRLRLTDLIAGDSVTIWEGDYENPPDDPYHCPATHTEVRVRRGGRVTRIALYYPVASPTGPPEGR